MTISERQTLADTFTNQVLEKEYGERFTSLEDVEDDAEINQAWELLNERFFDAITEFLNTK